MNFYAERFVFLVPLRCKSVEKIRKQFFRLFVIGNDSFQLLPVLLFIGTACPYAEVIFYGKDFHKRINIFKQITEVLIICKFFDFIRSVFVYHIAAAVCYAVINSEKIIVIEHIFFGIYVDNSSAVGAVQLRNIYCGKVVIINSEKLLKPCFDFSLIIYTP